jgi:hypothetical protein
MEQNDLAGIIRKLRAIGQEWDTVDAKQDLILREVGDKAEFVKDVVAMANNGEPSCLIIGLEDETFAPERAFPSNYSKHLNNLTRRVSTL